MEASEENPVYVLETEDGKQAFYQDQLEEIEEEEEKSVDNTDDEKKDTEKIVDKEKEARS